MLVEENVGGRESFCRRKQWHLDPEDVAEEVP